MPEALPSRLAPIVREFVQHWHVVNAVLGADGPLIVLRNVSREDLVGLLEALESGPADVAAALNAAKLPREALRRQATAMHDAMKRFNLKVRGDFPESRIWPRVLATVPSVGDGFDVFVPPLRFTRLLWEKIEAAIGGEFDLEGVLGICTAAEFAAGLDALEAAYDARAAADLETELARIEWDRLEARATDILKAYGHGVKAQLGDEAALARSLPQLWPGPRRGQRRKANEPEAGHALTPESAPV